MSKLAHIKVVNKKYNIFTSIRAPSKTPVDEFASFSPLFNTTYAIKDNFTTRNEPTTCSSLMLSNYKSPFDSTVVTLLNQSGSQCIGKTNMDEFGMGNSTTSSYFGPTLNSLYPQTENLFIDYEEVIFSTKDIGDKNGEFISSDIVEVIKEGYTINKYYVPKLNRDEKGKVIFNNIDSRQRITGGSSGGSATAVGLDLVDFAIGSDTGGSVRLPACYNNIYGFKPTYGRISRWGLVAYAQSLDTVGIMSKEVDTIWKVFSTLDLADSKDPTSLSDSCREEIAIERINSKKNVGKKFKIGIPIEYKFNELSEDIKQSWEKLLNKLKENKLIEIIPISIPSVKYSLPAYYTLVTSEASSNLSRYDGNRYGFRTEDYEGEEPEFRFNRGKAFGEEVKRRILLGNYSLSSYGYDNNYKKASNVRRLLIEEFNKVFRDKHCLMEKKQLTNANGIDLMIVPTSVNLPKLINEGNGDIVEGYMNDVCTIPMSLAGLPTMNIPFENFGFQIVGQHGQDYKVLEFTRLVNNIL